MSKEQPVILITGTSTGFGREAVHQYAAAGYTVIATMRNLAKADPSFKDNPNIDLAKLDITDKENATDLVAKVVAKYGHLDVLYNNAGYNESGAFEEVADDAARREMETNFWGPVNMIRAVLPIMRQPHHGHILNTSSMAAYLNLPLMTFYSASKAAVTSMSDTLHKEVSGLGIQVTDIEPGGFNTNFGVNSKLPAHQLPDYAPVYQRSAEFNARVFIEAGLGDLKKAVALIVRETLNPDAPLHLVVGMQGYDDARAYLEKLIGEYDGQVELTKTTDPEPDDVNVFKYIYQHAAAGKQAQLKELLVQDIMKFQTNGKIADADLLAVMQLVAPDAQQDVQQRLVTTIRGAK